MADNITVTPGTGATIAAESLGGALVQRVKLAIGAVDVDNGDVSATNPIPVTGTITANAGTGTFAVSAASLPLPSGAATSANQATEISSLSTIATNTTLQVAGTALASQGGELWMGSVTTAAPTYTTGQINFASLNTSGGLRVDGSGVTQPVSGTVTANAGTGSFTVAQATAANLQALVTQQSLTKGTQGANGVTNQALKDAGRNTTNYFMVLPIITTATDTLQSLTGYKSGATVAATTTPAVVTAGKTYRIIAINMSYVAITTAGSAKFTLRANTGGVVAIGSPMVSNWIVGGFSATAGVANSYSVDIPDGMEFAAGTGLGVSVVGLGATQTATTVGYAMISIQGFEY